MTSHTYIGKKELYEYIKKTEVPSFSDFIEKSKENVIVWSSGEFSNLVPKQLYALWKTRFALALRDNDKMQLICNSKNTFEKQLWETICRRMQSVVRLSRSETTTDAIENTTTVVSNTASNLLSSVAFESIVPASPSSSTTGSVLSVVVKENNSDEITMHAIAYKKLSFSSKLSNEDLIYLRSYKTDGSFKSNLFLLASKLLLKESLTVMEEETLELSLSGIYNCLNPAILAVYKKELVDIVLPTELVSIDNYVMKAPENQIREVFEKVSQYEEMNDALWYLQMEKAILSKNRERGGDRYAILSIVEKVIEDTELWRKDGDEQELTFYRRFASIMDVLFKNSEVVLADGETGSSSSRIAIEANKCVFAGEDTSPTYSRKIDLLLKYDEKNAIDLCSNEWKKSKVTNELKIKQQSKNMRVNACIINDLQARYGIEFNSILAMDVIGLNGYMYKLTKIDNYFIASPFSLITIPRHFSAMSVFEDVLVHLFYFKDFYKHFTQKLSKCIQKDEAKRDIGNVFLVNSTVKEQHEHPYPFVFFKSKKRKSSATADDDEA